MFHGQIWKGIMCTYIGYFDINVAIQRSQQKVKHSTMISPNLIPLCGLCYVMLGRRNRKTPHCSLNMCMAGMGESGIMLWWNVFYQWFLPLKLSFTMRSVEFFHFNVVICVLNQWHFSFNLFFTLECSGCGEHAIFARI